MKSKREKQLRQRIKRADIEQRLTGPAPVKSERGNWLNEQLKRAEEAGDMVKQNLIMEEIAKLEMGA